MKLIYTVYLTSILLGILACNTSAEMSAANVYNKNGIRFLYPQSWRVTEDSESSEVRYLHVAGPANAILIIQVYSQHKAVSLSEYANWFSDLARKKLVRL